MSRVYSFHETVRGHLHVMREIPCEDYSESYSADNGKYHVAVVADGHGSSECFRSAFGSKAVSEVALRCLKDFAESVMNSTETEDRFYHDIFTNPRYRQMTIRRLTDTIIAEWHDVVSTDYSENPPTEEEIGEHIDKYKNNNNILHIYGTTLIAALLLPQCLILLHQGDGRCDVFYDDGSVNQPIPWDTRCVDTSTTSMCDSDVETSIRNCVIDLSKKKVIACYLGCDGIEDAYRDTYDDLGGSHCIMGGVHTFYKDLTCQLSIKSIAEFEEYLRQMLPEFSANGRFSRSGSGDDVSVAGFVDLDEILQWTSVFRLDIEKYSLEEELFWKESELRGKTRKHEILKKRMQEASTSLTTIRSEIEKIQDEKKELSIKRDLLVKQSEETKAELEQFKKDSDEMTSNIDSTKAEDNSLKTFMKMMALTAQEVYEQISNGKNQIESRYRKQLEQILAYEQQIKILEERLSNQNDILNSAENSYGEAEKAFLEFDEIYRTIESECQDICAKISSLTNKA